MKAIRLGVTGPANPPRLRYRNVRKLKQYQAIRMNNAMKNYGPCVYFDTSVKDSAGKKRHNVWRADITVDDIRYRRRDGNKRKLERWLKGMKADRR
jgi:hypothetical protein